MTKIKEIRNEQLLSQTFVASLLNLTVEEYNEIENKGFDQTAKEMQNDLCELFGVDPKDLKDTLNNLSHEEMKIEQLKKYKLIVNRAYAASPKREDL